jgi:glycosyltransferase involved in cell wall biosynthesis
VTSDRIQILFLIDKLTMAGAQNHVFQLATEIDRRRFAPRVCCLTSGGPLADRLRERDVPVSVLGIERIYDGAAARAMAGFVRRLRRERIQVLHTFLVSANVFGTVAGRLARVPVVVTSRRDTGFSRSPRLRTVEEWLINPLADQVVAVSEAAAAVARAERALAAKVVTIPNGVRLRDDPETPSARERYRRELGVADGERLVGIVANLTPVKGHADLLAAAARVVAQAPDVRFVLVGDGPLRGELEAQARSLGIADRVVMTGQRGDVRDLLGALDVAVLSSHTEGMSNVVLEYMAAGLPVVATAVGGNPEVIEDGRTGRLVPPRDAPAMAGALLALLTDRAAAARLGQAAQRHIREHLTLERMVQRHEELYTGLLRRRNIVGSE